MQPSSLSPGRRACALALVFALSLILMLGLCRCAELDPCAYPYNTYLLQAQAWLRGEAALDYDREFLELAQMEDKLYVSFPPVPSIPMVPLALIFGDDVPGGLVQKLYAALIPILILSELLRRGRMDLKDAFLWSLLFCFASALLPVTMVGGVWFEAQILALLFTTAAVILMLRLKPTGACLCYALSVGCRPFSALLGPVLLLIWLELSKKEGMSVKSRILKLVPGLIVGLMIAAAYGWYNFIRFSDVFEFGHNYLPEFKRSTYGQLSLHYLAQNIPALLFGTPFKSVGEGAIEFEIFGFSMFLSCPLLICGLVWTVRDVIRRRMNVLKWACFICAVLNALLLCMHRTLGGHQFGLRYALELFPYLLIPLLTDPERRGLERWEAALLFAGLLFNFIGGIAVHV